MQSIHKHITFTEIILIFSGFVFIVSTIYLAFGGDLAINFLAKGFYIFGTILLVFKS